MGIQVPLPKAAACKGMKENCKDPRVPFQQTRSLLTSSKSKCKWFKEVYFWIVLTVYFNEKLQSNAYKTLGQADGLVDKKHCARWWPEFNPWDRCKTPYVVVHTSNPSASTHIEMGVDGGPKVHKPGSLECVVQKQKRPWLHKVEAESWSLQVDFFHTHTMACVHPHTDTNK